MTSAPAGGTTARVPSIGATIRSVASRTEKFEVRETRRMLLSPSAVKALSVVL